MFNSTDQHWLEHLHYHPWHETDCKRFYPMYNSDWGLIEKHPKHTNAVQSTFNLSDWNWPRGGSPHKRGRRLKWVRRAEREEETTKHVWFPANVNAAGASSAVQPWVVGWVWIIAFYSPVCSFWRVLPGLMIVFCKRQVSRRLLSADKLSPPHGRNTFHLFHPVLPPEERRVQRKDGSFT